MEIKERYVSYEVAKLLKDKGFSQKCRVYYINGVRHIHTHGEVIPDDAGIVECPTQQMACDWVLEKYGVSIEPMWFCFSEIKIWDCVIVSSFICQKWVGRIKKEDYKTKEEAINDAILYVLKNDLKRQ